MADFFSTFFSPEQRWFFEANLHWIPLWPCLGAILNGLFHRRIGRGVSGLVACLAAGLAFLWALACFVHMEGTGGQPLHQVWMPWLVWDGFQASIGFGLDALSGTMALVVTGVGFLIHLYSVGYMGHERAYGRYFCYLNLFLFAMLLLVLGDNLLVMFAGWEGVGLCSYLLIGFWYQDLAKAAAGMKAFIFNRIGDLGFVLGIFLLISLFGTADFFSGTAKPGAVPARTGLLDLAGQIRAVDPLGERPLNAFKGGGGPDLSGNLGLPLFGDLPIGFLVGLAALLLFIGAMGKSAQFPLYAWLPDAMAGPTPVSALIHAATMVTAGVYMAVRLQLFFSLSPWAMQTVAAFGAGTALFAALIGLTQTDIKKVLAYSTVSQLGFMFLAAGAGAFSLAIFHVVTHAFFKALLFLGAGSVIHALGGEQDLRNMGGLRAKLPVTFWTMLCGAAALAGAPFTAGWFSKDPLLGNVLTKAESGPFFAILYAAALIAALGTAFYTARLIFLTFLGPYRGPEETAGKIHESPWTMTLPLILLAIASLAGGALLWTQTPFFRVQDVQSHSAHGLNLAATSLALALGAGGAFFLYRIRKAFPPAGDSPNLFHRLSLRKFYFEWFVDRVVTGVFSAVSELIHLLVDVLLIDTLFVSGAGWLARGVGRALARMQTGLVNTYAAWILCGALIVLYILLR